MSIRDQAIAERHDINMELHELDQRREYLLVKRKALEQIIRDHPLPAPVSKRPFGDIQWPAVEKDPTDSWWDYACKLIGGEPHI